MRPSLWGGAIGDGKLFGFLRGFSKGFLGFSRVVYGFSRGFLGGF